MSSFEGKKINEPNGACSYCLILPKWLWLVWSYSGPLKQFRLEVFKVYEPDYRLDISAVQATLSTSYLTVPPGFLLPSTESHHKKHSAWGFSTRRGSESPVESWVEGEKKQQPWVRVKWAVPQPTLCFPVSDQGQSVSVPKPTGLGTSPASSTWHWGS